MDNLTPKKIVSMYAEYGQKITPNEAIKLIEKIKASKIKLMAKKKVISDAEFFQITDTI